MNINKECVYIYVCAYICTRVSVVYSYCDA